MLLVSAVVFIYKTNDQLFRLLAALPFFALQPAASLALHKFVRPHSIAGRIKLGFMRKGRTRRVPTDE